jgi:phosphoglycolate phosphatase-like HAD superfamily hydrolase
MCSKGKMFSTKRSLSQFATSLVFIAVFILSASLAFKPSSSFPAFKMLKTPTLPIALTLEASSNQATSYEEDSFRLPLQQANGNHPESAQAAAAAFVASLRSSRRKMIVFDKDGTLGDCTASLRRWVLHMTARVQGLAVQVPQAKQEILIRQFHAKIGWNAERCNVVPSAPVAAGTWNDVVELVHAFLIENQDLLNTPTSTIARDLAQQWHDELGDLHAADAPLVEDLAGLMKACRQLGYIVAICTSDDRHATNLAMKAWKIDGLVDASICGDEVAQGKPSPVPLQTLCRQQHTTPQECIVVGDTTADTGMAQAAKAGFCVGVLTGSGTAPQLLDTGAHLILPHVGHIPTLLQTFQALALESPEDFQQ